MFIANISVFGPFIFYHYSMLHLMLVIILVTTASPTNDKMPNK